MPEFVGIEKAENINIKDVNLYFIEVAGKSTPLRNKLDFETVKSDLLKLLKQDRTALILMQTSNLISVNHKAVKTNALGIKNFLIKNGIGNNRIFIKRNSDFISDSDYPAMTIVHQK